jgi:nitrogen-specific signal transduction histidine kinase
MNMQSGSLVNITLESAPTVAASTGTQIVLSERATPTEIDRQTAAVERESILLRALDAIPNMVMILNPQRQIVAANRKVRATLKSSADEIASKRPGEAIRCLHAKDGPDGCGTGNHCSTCGAADAIVGCLVNREETIRECRVLVGDAPNSIPLDLRVTASPFELDSELFTTLTLEDISDAKRVAVLQRAFFHDVLNTAGCLQGYAEILADDVSAGAEFCDRIVGLSGQLINEINAQRDLIRAESGELSAHPTPLHAGQVLEELRTQYLNHSVAAGRHILAESSSDVVFESDRQLLNRVLGNMLKNALEATPPGETVTLSYANEADSLSFAVHNPGVMPREVQLQIFQRSFSTKAEAGRGIGTYSMKLLGERYLGGKVDFVSQEPDGTTFYLRLPKNSIRSATDA